MSDYDHVRDLASGAVRAEGVDLTWLTLTIEEIFYRFTRFREWDVSEMSMAKYAALTAAGDSALAAIPVFPSRVFRHSAIYVRRGAGVAAPVDLAGRRVGVPEWAQTAGIYARGALVHQYGVPIEDVEWVQAGVNQPGRTEAVELTLPPGVRLTRVADRTLDGMLRAGELDAAISAHPPASFSAGHPDVARLFPDPVPVEADYWRKTGIFPIMHVVAIRRDVFDRHPWVAMNLCAALEEAKRRSVARALDVTAARFPVPWGYAHAASARALFGDDLFPYGVEPNRPTLEAFLGFAHEQGVCRRRLAVEELFPREVRSRFRV
jgi:4,5-dihydroxyphthalate decarboxylase